MTGGNPDVPRAAYGMSAHRAQGLGIIPASDPWLAFENNEPPWLTLFSPELVSEIFHWLPVWVLRILLHYRPFAKMARSTLCDRVAHFFQGWDLPADNTLTMMRRRHTILSGSAALAIVEPGPWYPRDLDFYCPASQFDAVREWFTLNGYTVAQEVSSAYTSSTITRDDIAFPPEFEELYWDFPRVRIGVSNCISRVITMANIEDLEKGGSVRTINLIQSYSENAVAPVCFFHSTLLMNFVTGDGVVSLYPKLTSQGKGMLNVQLDPPLRPVSRSTLSALQKYQDRGYTFFQGTEDERTLTPSNCIIPGFAHRSWDDNHSIDMPFEAHHPVTLLPRVQWVLSRRVFTLTGFHDVNASVSIILDADEHVVYQNSFETTEVIMAPEAL